MDSTVSKTFAAVRAVLNHSVEDSVRLVRHSQDPQDVPIVPPEDEAAIPERCRGAVRASAQRLRELCADGDRIPAEAAIADEAALLAPTFPRGWELPKLDPAELAAKVPR